jgi:hypothetical protein
VAALFLSPAAGGEFSGYVVSRIRRMAVQLSAADAGYLPTEIVQNGLGPICATGIRVLTWIRNEPRVFTTNMRATVSGGPLCVQLVTATCFPHLYPAAVFLGGNGRDGAGDRRRGRGMINAAEVLATAGRITPVQSGSTLAPYQML